MIFPKKNITTKASTFIGAYLPSFLVETLTLYAMSRGESKTELLHRLVEKSLSKQIKDSAQLSIEVAKRAQQTWIEDWVKVRKKRKYKSRPAFLKACKEELDSKKGISKTSAKKIMQEITKRTRNAT